MSIGTSQVRITTSRASRARRRAGLLAAAIALGVPLAACGSGSAGGSLPTIDRSSTLLPPTTTTPDAAPSTSRPGPSRPPTTTTPGAPDAPTTTADPATTTDAPTTTLAPTTTGAPTTTLAPTTTAAPTTTDAPTTTAATTSTTGSTTTTAVEATTTTAPAAVPTAGDSSGTTWWPWALAAVIVAGGAALIVARSRRRAALLVTQTNDLLDQTTEVAGELAALDAAALQRLARPTADRLATLGAQLTSTAQATKDPAKAAALTALSGSVGGLHRSVDAVALSPAPPTDETVATVHQQAAQLHSLTEQTRATTFPPPTA
ncbi:hypothetical protein [Aquihabitans sp. McL0605]|uniref:hypothetical protein n=1 Tax=Aquihabitans sp. McL0605 TaxID=3415671 RepID=UPI003CF34A45